MNASDFIKKRLQALIEKFPQLKVIYGYDSWADAHYIKVLPPSEFNENEAYAEYEMDFILDFVEQFPYEEIVFFTEGDLIEIKKPLSEKAGERYFNVDVHFSDEKPPTVINIDRGRREVIKPAGKENEPIVPEGGIKRNIVGEEFIGPGEGRASYPLAA